MHSLEPICSQIARARGELALCLYFELSSYPNSSEMQTELGRFRRQIASYQHPNLLRKDIKPTEAVLVVDSPEAVQKVVGELSQGYRGMLHDVYITDDTGQRVGRSWELYDIASTSNPTQGIVMFAEEIALTALVPQSIKSRVNDFMKTEGASRFREKGLEAYVARWEALFA